MSELSLTKRFYTVKEFHTELGGIVSMGMVYKMIANGEIPTRKIGRKIAIPASWVQTFIDKPYIVVKKVSVNHKEKN